MKKHIYTILTILITLNSFSQSTDQQNFIGTWQWVDGNKTFTVTIFPVIDDNKYHLEGDYKMEETINGETTLIYKSNKFLGTQNGQDYYFGTAIYGDARSSTLFSASIDDNVLFFDGTGNGKTIKMGSLSINIINDSGTTTAHWKVNKLGGVVISKTPSEFSIPTDVIITKVE